MRLLPLLAIAVCLAACDRAPQRTTLVAYDFTAPHPDPLRDGQPAWGPDTGLHHFGAGWERDGSPGWWALHPVARSSLSLLGSSAELTLVFAAPPVLCEAGQTVTVVLNGRDLATLPVTRGWEPDTARVAVPDSLLRQGLNTLELRSRLALNEVAGPDIPDRRPLGTFVRALTVTADLDRDQREHWARWHGVGTADAPWEMVPVPERDTRPRPDAERPDLVVFVLDALRRDHVGHQGYGRATTPVLDGLAADGVVFTNVTAQASYTRCAVPGLLTGLPWTEHGVVRRGGEGGDALADSLVTVPEALAAAGYYTIGVSHNPNFSVSNAMDQGFREFTEDWTLPAFADTAYEMPERVVRQRLAAGLPDGPVCLWVHLLPPHLPYAPGPAHDLWRDDAATGLDEIRLELIRACEQPDSNVAPAVKRRIVDLYDGNIHRADASVGRMLAAWRAMNRDRDLVVAVVADHGEGFGEHGRWDHCTTLYDEMTRIPLLIWPRRLCPRWQEHAGAYLGGEDLAPLLLGLLDVPLVPGTTVPRRFLDVYAHGPVPRRETVVRTTVEWSTLGLRDDRWLAVWGGPTRQELYDLETDPEATENLRFRRPDLYNGMLGRLRGILATGAWLGSGGSGRALSPEEIRALKSLGYL